MIVFNYLFIVISFFIFAPILIYTFYVYVKVSDFENLVWEDLSESKKKLFIKIAIIAFFGIWLFFRFYKVIFE